MVRHYTAVEVDLGERGKGWHFASLGASGGGPIGFCANHGPHPSGPEARRCYREYERSLIRLDNAAANWGNCRAKVDGARCPKPANRYAQAGPYRVALLCDEHLTMEHAVPALHLDQDEASDSWQS